ncbi:methyltransferase domain-containing protein [Brevundimonas sp. 2R-24]|uniref:Methyltransferase domain-containing protein n=1 Tax=Peiella sedimenti TaxID=3061083 RepID=A0ABT8SN87_9CAUL|nr:methyltransferase domain-containing protein [Caulobacteraceae bacterium XZ-24]
MSAPSIFDARLRRLRLERAARMGVDADFLRARAADAAVDALSAILRDFGVAVDMTARTDAFEEALKGSPAESRVGTLIRADLTPPPGGVALDPERLALAPESVDLIVSLMGLHVVDDLPGALVQIRRALRPDGLFYGAFLGGRSLWQLREVLAEAEMTITGGAAFRVGPMADAQDAAGLLQRAGFALPVTATDRFTVRYASPLHLIRDLRAMGETFAARQRGPALRREVIALAAQLYTERHAEADRRIPAAFEIVSLSGWAPHPDQQKPLRPGSAKARLADALGVRETKV